MVTHVKIGFSPSKKVMFVCVNKSPLKVVKNVFYFKLIALVEIVHTSK